jgi:hypothetical protein
MIIDTDQRKITNINLNLIPTVMKTFTVLVIIVIIALSGNSQNVPYKNFGDTLGPFTIISFEEQTPYITILPLPQNSWQIGAPHKIFFNSSYTLPNALVTDTLNNYPVNNFSTFELVIGNFNNPICYPSNIFLDWRHKFDSDTLNDGGYITVSWDDGLTWTNVIFDDNPFFMYTPANDIGIGNNNLYNSWPVLVNGEPGFSGHSGDWVHSSLAWFTVPFNKPIDFPPDTMRLRFNFVSDNIEQNREGWMIDQIRIYSLDLGYGISEYLAGRSHSWYYPNPVTAAATFNLNRTYQRIQYEIFDDKGILLSRNGKGSGDSFVFERGNLAPGMYIMKLYLDKQIMDVHRIIID